jgi:hypothetical protein
VFVAELAPSSVNMNVFFWTNSRQANVLSVTDSAMTGIKLALDEVGVEIPEPAMRNAWEWDVVAEPLVARRLTVATDGRRWICGILMHDESGTAILALVAITFC